MKYAFVLGRVYTLSIAELIAVMEKPDPALGISGESINIIDASEEVIVIETSQKIQAEKLQKKLGGVIKILEIIDSLKKREQDSINFALKHYFKPSILKKHFLKDYKGKIQFGISLYLLDMTLAKGSPLPPNRNSSQNQRTVSAFGEPKRIGMMVKNTLTEGGSSVRLVLPEFNSLSLASVSVTKNLLLQKGAEICIIAGKNIIYTAKTLVVQDFEDYGRRDYQRPARDERQGMVPPKVAQIMLNLSGCKNNDTILDPFCGIGTVIQEGLLLNFRMIGSDINKNAIKGSEQNLEWFRNRYKIAPGKFGVEVCDATEVSGLIQKSGHTVEAVVTECTLGPIYSKYPSQEEIETNFKNLFKLYQKSFTEFSKFLPKKGRVILCIPAYRKNQITYEMFPNIDFITELGYTKIDLVSEKFCKHLRFLRLTNRKTAIYDRKDQIVAREIVIFEKL